MNSVRILLLAGFLGMGAFASAVPVCSISIHEELNNGKTESTAFKTELRSQKACATLAGMHQKIFSPDRIRKKMVFYSWKSSKTTPHTVAKRSHNKKGSALAYRKSSRSHKSNVY